MVATLAGMWLRVTAVCGLLVASLLLGFPYLLPTCPWLQGLFHPTWLYVSTMGRGRAEVGPADVPVMALCGDAGVTLSCVPAALRLFVMCHVA